ncbi:MAG: glutaminyl-peptide cyclotransferase [Flavobacteriales bacterium]|nr:glutaminyl-peptide cyclotransferase [Flavobacteriales bacterium]
MKPIVKIGALIIALAMGALLFLNPSGCNTDIKRDKGNRVKSKKECSIRALNGTVSSGEQIEYRFKNLSKKVALDSIVMIDETPVLEGAIGTYDLGLGRHDIRGRFIYSDSSFCESSWSVEILSDIEPVRMGYSVVSMHDHSATSYTQGLLFHNGRLYESTGQYGESLIHHYDPKRRDYTDRVDLSMDYFGEGITILDDKLYQLTYKSRKGFVYDIGSMQRIGEFDLPSAEGWGLTDDGSNLIMSDGTNTLIYLDPVTFEVVRRMPVYDNKEKVNALNELEFVDGFVYANLYGATIIAKIDSNTGKVVEYIDCRGILAPELQNPDQDVFNGIAYNPERRTFYLTGKYWPKLFEVRFIPKAS